MKKIIVKYFNDQLPLEEEKKLKNWLKDDKNKKLFNQIAKDNFDLNIIYSKVNSEKSYAEIDQIFYRKGRIINFIPNNFLKYAAAVIILITTGYFLAKNQFTSKPTLVEINNNIPIGTDKATLTLEDGTNVALEKGKAYENEEVSSDGEKIIYQSKLTKTKEKITHNYLTIPRGGEFYIELEDGTKVWLNADTKLKYPVKFIDGQSRDVELLYGEAYFVVSPNSNHNGDSFRVKKDNQYIEVLGTEFNVKSYKMDDSIETILVEGNVELTIGNQNRNLIPDQQLVYDKNSNKIELNDVDSKYLTSWRTGAHKFKNKEFIEVSKVLERWYDVTFKFENTDIEKLKINGVLRKYKNIEFFLMNLKNTNNIEYKIIDNQIIIK